MIHLHCGHTILAGWHSNTVVFVASQDVRSFEHSNSSNPTGTCNCRYAHAFSVWVQGHKLVVGLLAELNLETATRRDGETMHVMSGHVMQCIYVPNVCNVSNVSNVCMQCMYPCNVFQVGNALERNGLEWNACMGSNVCIACNVNVNHVNQCMYMM